LISIITCVHNQLGMNQLFFEALKNRSFHPFQLIVIDNQSSDGSADYFEAQGAEVIRNRANYSYPFCQNQGLARARHDHLMFLNNDVIVSKDWDRLALDLMAAHGLDLASCAGTNRLRRKTATRIHMKRWMAVKYPLLLLGNRREPLRFMHDFFFLWDFDGFCRRHRRRNAGRIVEGIAGFNLLMTRRGLEAIGPWDERLMAADFDVFLRAKARALEVGDIRPVHLLCEIYLHHFLRLTLKAKHAPYADADRLIAIEEKWDRPTIRRLMADSDRIYFHSGRSSADFGDRPSRHEIHGPARD
jgi:GT2 family glycosyltransferase